VIAKVVGHHAITGDPVLRAHDIRCGGEQWLASAGGCRAAKKTSRNFKIELAF
jgi:hypothetical protein